MKNQELFNLTGDIKKTINSVSSLESFIEKSPNLVIQDFDSEQFCVHISEIKKELLKIESAVVNIKSDMQDIYCLSGR